jgi:hypothetical protein
MGRTKVETAKDFKALVDEDYVAYKAKPLDLRFAYHLALGLFHLRDWTFFQYSGGPRWPYKKKLEKYQEALEGQLSEFGYMRDLANSVKHAKLNPKWKPSTQMVGLANTADLGGRVPVGCLPG